jgi:hypothetical protein
MDGKRYPWTWDYDIDAQQFDDILAGRLVLYGRLDSDWAAARLIEYAGYPEMMRRIGLETRPTCGRLKSELASRSGKQSAAQRQRRPALATQTCRGDCTRPLAQTGKLCAGLN